MDTADRCQSVTDEIVLLGVSLTTEEGDTRATVLGDWSPLVLILDFSFLVIGVIPNGENPRGGLAATFEECGGLHGDIMLGWWGG